MQKRASNERFSTELQVAIDLARKAGLCIAHIRQHKEALEIRQKKNNDHDVSLVTTADLQSNDIICKGLQAHFPEYGILSEEATQNTPYDKWWEKRYAWIIDPLDGTEDFIRGGNEFGVHIGLTEEGVPVLGVNYYPALDVLYWAVRGQGAYKQIQREPAIQLILNTSNDESVKPLRSKSDSTAKVIYEHIINKTVSKEEFNHSVKYVASTGLRLCLIAEGSYNFYVTKAEKAGLWDFVSGEIILKEAGGYISDWKGKALNYLNQKGQLIDGVLACGNQELFHKALSYL